MQCSEDGVYFGVESSVADAECVEVGSAFEPGGHPGGDDHDVAVPVQVVLDGPGFSTHPNGLP
ncbi:hypothetical protein BO226_02175 [Rhodococcus sp. 2G]|nr:hypothetical protein BO226_02175 [Rhodococcus sp. 2G]